MSLGRAVPWASWAEWRQVGLWLLSQAPEDVQHGLERVAAWRARGRVPLGVDSTACLVEAQLRDRAAAAATSGGSAATTGALCVPSSSEFELRLQYGMAVVRMVNGIADSAQRGRVAASVASLAAAAGLPRILVDLRHEATHNELPSLQALRLAAQHGLAWLQGNYWQRQSDHVHACSDRIRGLVQEYLELHQAAAAKVAATAAAADSEDSEEEDGRGLTAAAAAAAAAAASVSRGRKAAGRRAAGCPGDDADGAGDGQAGSGYQAADAKKRRKQLLAEIRGAVPRPAAAMLADAMLAASTAAAAAAAGDAAAGSVAERGLAATLGHLTSLFPQLPALLLLGAARQLAAAAAAAATGDGAAAIPAATCLFWLRRLLPAPQQQQRQQSSGGGGGAGALLAATHGWAPPPAVLRQLLAELLPAHAAAAQRAALQGLAGAGSAGGSGEGALAEHLQQAVGMVSSALGPGPAGKVATSLAALAGCAEARPGQDSAPGPAAAPGDAAAAPEAQLAAAADSQRALLQRLERRAQQGQPPGKRGVVQSSQPNSSQAGGGAAAAPARKRWRRAQGWQPCAIGMLPCAADPNGTAPPLDLPTLLDLPAPFLQQQAAEAAAAAAAAAAQHAAQAGHGRAARQEDSAAAVLLRELQEAPQHEQGPWPAADRFVAAAAGGEAAAEEAEEQDGWPCQSVGRILPQQAALLV